MPGLHFVNLFIVLLSKCNLMSFEVCFYHIIFYFCIDYLN